MKYLLDVNVLLAGIVATHPQHGKAGGWLKGKEVVLCPVCELGFLRIGSHPRAVGLTMDKAREVLEKFVRDQKAERISDDLPALSSHPRSHDQVTDHYLSDLASKHGFKLATLDARLKHLSVELVR